MILSDVTIKPELLPALFDLVTSYGESRPLPTEESIAVINRHLDVLLPQSLIEFAPASRRFSAWFAGLGEDYSAPGHIIRVNSRAKRIRRRVNRGKWTYMKPREFVVINRGFDDDFDCLDTVL